MPATLPEDSSGRTASGAPSPRSELVRSLADAADRFAAQSSRFNALVAQQAGIGDSDLVCLRVILAQNGATAGELTAATGLTSGATTGTMNRLEARGLARREPVVGDRRRTTVRPRALALNKIVPTYQRLHDAVAKALSDYSDTEIKTARKIIEHAVAAMLEETSRIAAKDVRRRKARSEEPQQPS